jgi:hypothetical protein
MLLKTRIPVLAFEAIHSSKGNHTLLAESAKGKSYGNAPVMIAHIIRTLHRVISAKKGRYLCQLLISLSNDIL